MEGHFQLCGDAQGLNCLVGEAEPLPAYCYMAEVANAQGQIGDGGC